MAFTALATRVYKDAVTTTWANSLKQNDDYLVTAAAKVWVCFDGNTATMTAKGAMNVSNIVDSGAGLYTVFFTTGFTSTNFAVITSLQGTGAGDSSVAFQIGYTEKDSGSVAIRAAANTSSPSDVADVSVVCFGNLK